MMAQGRGRWAVFQKPELIQGFLWLYDDDDDTDDEDDLIIITFNINISTKVLLCNNPYNVLRGFIFWTVYML